jgi:hypothetical protein
MFVPVGLKLLAVQTIALIACLPHPSDSLIITSVLAGDKKFKTISFDHKWLKPLTFEKDMPNTEFRRHRTMRPPKFDIDVNIPIKLPLDDEYPQEEYKKPVESNIFFQTGEIQEPGQSYGHKPTSGNQQYTYSDQYAAASNGQVVRKQAPAEPPAASGINLNMADGFKGLLPALAKSIKIQPQFIINEQAANARSDNREPLAGVPGNPTQFQPQFQFQPQPQQLLGQPPAPQAMAVASSNQHLARSYAPPPPKANYQDNYQDPEFVPGGFVNLQLSGPTGGPKMTYEDLDKEHWAQQLSQTPGAMPYPILNYQQLQNFYGGLGTFTNGLAEHRYVQVGLLDKLKSGLNHFTNKFHFG